MKTKILAVLVALAAPAFASPAIQSSDQTVTFTAEIEPATLASFCQEETHFISCNGSLLRSTVLNLDKYVGKPYEFTATLAGVECPIWYITAAVPAKGTLTFCGNAVPGCPIRMRVGPTGVIGEWMLWYSTQAAFAPIDPIFGTVMIGPPYEFLGAGLTFGPTAAFDAVVPQSPGITGLKVFAQGIRRDIGKIGPWTLTNPECFTILGPSPPCILPGC